MNDNKLKPYFFAIDYIRTISILGVVLIHTTTRVLEASGYALNNFYWTLLLNQIARFAVPLFFLISGFVLELNYDFHQNYWSYLKKRLSKIFIPYVFWSCIYYFLIYTQNHDNFLKVILTGDASYQLYFIPTLLIFYLIFPFIHKAHKYIINLPVLTILGAVQLYLLNLDYFIKQFTFPDPIRISLLAFFIFIFGIFAARFQGVTFKASRTIIYALILPIIYLGFYIFNEGNNLYFKTYDIKAIYSQWRPDVLIYTILIFIFLFYIFDNRNFGSKIVKIISKLSFLVFFIHVIIIEVLWKTLGHNFYTTLGFDILFFASVSCLSFLIAYLIHKIPHLAKITG